MSGRGAAVLGLALLISLGALGLWLVNVPLWGIALVSAAAAWAARWLVRRLSPAPDRQKTET